MNAPSSARSSKRSLRGRDTRQGTQFGRRGVGTGLGVSSAGDTNSWLWPASRASKSSKAIGPTGLFEGGAALKPARARAAMPKRGCGPTGLPSEPAPKSAAFRVDDARAARDGAWRSQTTASWQPRRSRRAQPLAQPLAGRNGVGAAGWPIVAARRGPPCGARIRRTDAACFGHLALLHRHADARRCGGTRPRTCLEHVSIPPVRPTVGRFPRGDVR